MLESDRTTDPSIPEDPTVEADEADPTKPGPGDSDAAKPEPED